MSPPFRVRLGQGTLLLVVACALSITSAAATDALKACADDDGKWAAYNSSCSQMKWLCNNDGYGMLVRRWCPRTCGLCTPPRSTSSVDDSIADSEGDDTVMLLGPAPGGRAVPLGTSSFELSVTDKARRNTTRSVVGDEVLRPSAIDPSSLNTSFNDSLKHFSSSNASFNGSLKLIASSNTSFNNGFEHLSSSNASFNDSFTEDKHPNATESSAPTKWEITLPFKDALVHVLAKATLVPRALWSSDEDTFVWEVHNDSQNLSGNISIDKNRSTTLLQDADANQCPGGYAQVIGHVYGGDQFGRGYNLFAESARGCARLCTHTPGCGSFEYSRIKKRCFRNSQTRPTSLSNREGYILCRRAPCPSFFTEAACVGPAVSPGWLSAEVRLHPGSYCIWSGGKCQAPMACTFEDCFLPDGGLPGMDLPLSKTLWISRSGLMSTMPQSK